MNKTDIVSCFQNGEREIKQTQRIDINYKSYIRNVQSAKIKHKKRDRSEASSPILPEMFAALIQQRFKNSTPPSSSCPAFSWRPEAETQGTRELHHGYYYFTLSSAQFLSPPPSFLF